MITIERLFRPTIKATRQEDGSVIVRAGHTWIQFNADELQQLYVYAANLPTIQHFPVVNGRR